MFGSVVLTSLQTDLLEVRGFHAAKCLGRQSMMSQNRQVVLSGQSAQQVDQLFLHACFLHGDTSFTTMF